MLIERKLLPSTTDQLAVNAVDDRLLPFTAAVPFIVIVGFVVSLMLTVIFFTSFVELTLPSVSFAITLKLIFLPSNSLCPVGIGYEKLTIYAYKVMLEALVFKVCHPLLVL